MESEPGTLGQPARSLESERGPLVLRVPGEMWREHEAGDDRSEPGPRSAQRVAVTAPQRPRKYRADQDHVVLREQPESGGEAGADPAPPAAAEGGGGFAGLGATLTIDACVVSDNHADLGAGVAADDAQLTVTQAFAPLLGADRSRKGPPGRIVMISSVGGRNAAPFLGPYAASKFALEGLSESLRRELMIFGIDVIVVAVMAKPCTLGKKAKGWFPWPEK